ncbi:Pr6Pr family membrane protein [Saccharothrix sp. NRRL B-16314]|uniref:Pr6Pr family membrane protein n=1 Tax=Saccharothrix sp. NRRL B-16314 TaxID=1463825 RepID=UPI000ADE9B7D|nr:Pr6Pr family membrane protein [Saccharothrix sp. NRRL B-16314]
MSTEAAHANTDAPRPSTAWSTGSRVWHGLLAAVIAAALVTQLVLLLTGGVDVNSGQAEVPAPIGVRLLRLFSYFTIQSNVFVLAVSLTLALNPRRDGRGWRVARLDALLGIAITGVVFDLLLARLVHPVGAAWWVNLGFHRLAPLMAVLGWLLFGPRPRVDWASIARALFVWPVLWIAYTFVHGAITDWYPYPFLDVTVLGFGAALRNALLVLVLAAVLAVVAKALDAKLRPAPA